MLNAESFLTSARHAANLGREILLNYFGNLSNVNEKHLAGLVSEADRESEQAIKKFLIKTHPEIPFLGEETGWSQPDSTSDLPHLWMVDPLDGTNNYVHQFPLYCVSIGLKLNNQLSVAVIDVPALDQQFYALKGKGAYRNNIKIKVSQRKKLDQTLLATGFPTVRTTSDLNCQLEILRQVLPKVRDIRRSGSAAFDLCMVAQGTFDGYWEKGLSPWDTAAGALLVREAGGLVTSYEGADFDPFDKSLIAASPYTHPFLQKIVHQKRL